MSTSGCAIGNVGAILARVTEAQGAWVVDVYVIGLDVRLTQRAEAGITFGASHRAYVFGVEDIEAPKQKLIVFFARAFPWDLALLRHTENVGVDVRFASPTPGVTVGAQRITASRPAFIAENAF